MRCSKFPVCPIYALFVHILNTMYTVDSLSFSPSRRLLPPLFAIVYMSARSLSFPIRHLCRKTISVVLHIICHIDSHFILTGWQHCHLKYSDSNTDVFSTVFDSLCTCTLLSLPFCDSFSRTRSQSSMHWDIVSLDHILATASHSSIMTAFDSGKFSRSPFHIVRKSGRGDQTPNSFTNSSLELFLMQVHSHSLITLSMNTY